MIQKKRRHAELYPDDRSKINSKKLEEILRLYQNDIPKKEIASKYGLDYSHICKVIRQHQEDSKQKT